MYYSLVIRLAHCFAGALGAMNRAPTRLRSYPGRDELRSMYIKESDMHARGKLVLTVACEQFHYEPTYTLEAGIYDYSEMLRYGIMTLRAASRPILRENTTHSSNPATSSLLMPVDRVLRLLPALSRPF